MKNPRMTQQIIRSAAAGALLLAAALPASAIDLKTSDGAWTFSMSGNVNVDYIYSDCDKTPPIVLGFTCTASSGSGGGVSTIGNGLLPAAFAFSAATTQNGIDLAAHLGLFPGIATNDGGSPNLQSNSANGSSNTALGTTGLDIRQVYMTFGTKEMGTFTLGRNIGLFAADVILNDMTLPGVGAPGSAASPAPSNTTLGGIGFGYIYTDWLAQIDYTTPDIQGFSGTLGVFNPINSLTDPGTPLPKSSPGFHLKASFTAPLSNVAKLYASVTYLTQKQEYPGYNYTGDGWDIFAKLDVTDFELIGYYYKASGLGTTALFLGGAFGAGQTRDSDGYFAQGTYKVGDVKFGINYGESKLDYANSTDATLNPNLVSSNKKFTGGVYYSLTKNLTLLGEFSDVKSEAHGCPVGTACTNSSTTFNVGAYLAF